MGRAGQMLNIYNMLYYFVGNILNIYDILVYFDGSKFNIKNIHQYFVGIIDVLCICPVRARFTKQSKLALDAIP